MTRADIDTILAAQDESGAILACPAYPTYRYSWLRDGAFCAVALDAGDAQAASRRFHAWVGQRVLAFEAPMRRAIEAAAIGEEPGPEDFLPCRFAASGHVPTGDGWGAFQLDGPGLWLWALREHAQASGGQASLEGESRRAAALAAEYVAALWRQPSYDAWEEHGEHLSTSTLAACLAGLLSAHRLGIELDGMHATVEAIRQAIAERGRRLGYLPRSDGDDAVDASILWCGPLLGAIHRDDPAWRATLARIETELIGPEGGVHRYATDTFYGGGQWPVLTASLGLALFGIGQPGHEAAARRSAAWIEQQRHDDGSLPEQSSEHLLHPSRLREWESRWGFVARPLTWSHAMAILLRRAIESV